MANDCYIILHSADQFSSFFNDKIKTLCLNLPLININPFSVFDKSPPIFPSFKPESFDEIKQLILSSSKSTSQSDPIPYNLLPHCVDSIVSIVTRIVNLSHNTGTFPNEFNSAFVKLLLNKPNHDSNDLKNYCPISNLSFLFKLTELVIVDRLLSHPSAHNFMSKFQSAIADFILVKLLSHVSKMILLFRLMLVVPLHFS